MSGSYLFLDLSFSFSFSSDITFPGVLCPLLRNISTENVFIGLCLAPRPTPAWITSVSLFVWTTIHLSGIEGLANSYTTASTATRIISSHQPHHYIIEGYQ